MEPSQRIRSLCKVLSGWFHQQFNTGPLPALYAPTSPGFMNRSVGNASAAVVSIKEGGGPD